MGEGMSPEERLIRFMLGHMAAGIAAGLVFGGALIATNVAGLKDLLLALSSRELPLHSLFMLFQILMMSEFLF